MDLTQRQLLAGNLQNKCAYNAWRVESVSGVIAVLGAKMKVSSQVFALVIVAMTLQGCGESSTSDANPTTDPTVTDRSDPSDPSEPTGEETPFLNQVLSDIGNNVILPTYASFKGSASSLVTALSDYQLLLETDSASEKNSHRSKRNGSKLWLHGRQPKFYSLGQQHLLAHLSQPLEPWASAMRFIHGPPSISVGLTRSWSRPSSVMTPSSSKNSTTCMVLMRVNIFYSRPVPTMLVHRRPLLTRRVSGIS